MPNEKYTKNNPIIHNSSFYSPAPLRNEIKLHRTPIRSIISQTGMSVSTPKLSIRIPLKMGAAIKEFVVWNPQDIFVMDRFL